MASTFCSRNQTANSGKTGPEGEGLTVALGHSSPSTTVLTVAELGACARALCLLRSFLAFHARMAAYLGAPTEFRLLNPPCTLGGDSLQVCFCESVRVMSTGAGTARRFRNSERDADWRRQTR